MLYGSRDSYITDLRKPIFLPVVLCLGFLAFCPFSVRTRVNVTIQMRATEQYNLVVLLIMLHNVVLTLSLTVKSKSDTTEIKAIERYFPVVLCIMLYKLVLTFEPLNDIEKRHHSSKSYYTVLSCGTVSLSLFSKALGPSSCSDECFL